MDQGLVFWEKYFKSQIEVTWDEFANSFSQMLLEVGKINLDEDQLLFIKSQLDPDYRNIVKVAHFLIFYDTYWKIPSKKQALYKHNFKVPVFQIPKQIMSGLSLKIKAITHGYSKGERDIFIDRTKWIKTAISTQNIDESLPQSAYIQSMYIVQTPQEEHLYINEEIFTIGNKGCDMMIKDDLQINQKHFKIIWTPYNLFLMKDLAKSFRTTLRLQNQQYYLMDYLSVYKLGPETAFYISFLNPLPHFMDEMLESGIRYIETSQENTDNYFPFLIKQLQTYRFNSVSEYRHAIDKKEIQSSNIQLTKIQDLYKQQQSQIQLTDNTINQIVIDFIAGPLKGKQYPLTNQKQAQYIVGRSKDCDIQVQDHFLQDQQIRIFYNQQYGWLIEHLEPTENDQCADPTIFGTFLLIANKTQLDLGLPSKAHVIQEGMNIGIGPYLFEVQYQQILQT